MPFLRKRDTGAVTDELSEDSREYQLLKSVKFATNVTAFVPAGQTPVGGSGGSILAGQPMWEAVAEEDVNDANGRVLVADVPPAATAGTETADVTTDRDRGGTLTDVEYVPSSAVTGQATNNRTITLQQVAVTATPARTVTALANVAWDATHSNAGNQRPTALTITTAAFSGAAPEVLQVVSAPVGTGLADPGGVLYAVYTPA